MKCVLVTGGRDYSNSERVFAELDRVKPDLLIEGGATGADALARKWAEDRGVHYVAVPALWNSYGNAAGPRRNIVMVSLLAALASSGCDCLVVAFPGGRGTRNCVAAANERKLHVMKIPS
jgi:hypothetical protein